MSMIYDIRSSAPYITLTENLRFETFFIDLYRPSRNTSSSPVSSEATLVGDEQDLFAADRETYDFEQNLPSSILNNIRGILNEEDPFPLKLAPKRVQLNPQAQAFVPGMRFNSAGNSNSARLAAIDAVETYYQRYYNRPLPPPLQRSVGPWPTAPPHTLDWKYRVNLAVHTSPVHMSSIYEQGLDLLHHGRVWGLNEMRDLIRYIFWKGAEPSFHIHPLSVALLAFSIHCHLKNSGDQKTAALFASILQECAVGYFEALWDAQNQQSAIRFTPNASYPPEYLNCASHFAAFIGCLYRCDVIDRNLVIQCLWVLVRQVTALEHLNVIHDLIACSGVYSRLEHGSNHQSVGDTIVPLVQRFTKALMVVVNQRPRPAGIDNSAGFSMVNQILRLVSTQSECSIDQVRG